MRTRFAPWAYHWAYRLYIRFGGERGEQWQRWAWAWCEAQREKHGGATDRWDWAPSMPPPGVALDGQERAYLVERRRRDREGTDLLDTPNIIRTTNKSTIRL